MWKEQVEATLADRISDASLDSPDEGRDMPWFNFVNTKLGSTAACERVDAREIDAEKFRKMMDTSIPVVLTHVTDDWADPKLWLPASLRERCASCTVQVQATRDGVYYGTKVVGDQHWAVRPAMMSMLLPTYLDLLSVPRNVSKAAFYIQHESLHQKLNPLSHLVEPLPFASKLAGRSVNLWAGADPAVSRVHSDAHENVLVVLAGRKDLVLFPPTDRKHLGYAPKPGIHTHYSFPGHFQEQKVPSDKRVRVCDLLLCWAICASQLNVCSPLRTRRTLRAQTLRLYGTQSAALFLFIPFTARSAPEKDCISRHIGTTKSLRRHLPTIGWCP